MAISDGAVVKPKVEAVETAITKTAFYQYCTRPGYKISFLGSFPDGSRYRVERGGQRKIYVVTDLGAPFNTANVTPTRKGLANGNNVVPPGHYWVIVGVDWSSYGHPSTPLQIQDASGNLCDSIGLQDFLTSVQSTSSGTAGTNVYLGNNKVQLGFVNFQELAGRHYAGPGFTIVNNSGVGVGIFVIDCTTQADALYFMR